MPLGQKNSGLLVLGGSDAGVSAALRARELCPDLPVRLILADGQPNFSICGLPFLISGETPAWPALAHRTPEEIRARNIDLSPNTLARALDPAGRKVVLVSNEGRLEEAAYDQLVVATGAQTVRPPLNGLESPGVFTLRRLTDALALMDYLETRRPGRAAIIGAGYIGLEMADALTRRGLEVSLIQRSPQVLKTFDPDLAGLVQAELESNGVRVLTGRSPGGIESRGGRLAVLGAGGLEVSADLVLVAAGVRPNPGPAPAAGAEVGTWGALKVDRRMRTSLPDVYAAGDCVETWHRLLKQYTYQPLGTVAHKQGRAAGENAAGGRARFAGSLGTQAVKVFDLVAARTGLLPDQTAAAPFRPRSVTIQADDHKAYYPGSSRMTVRLTADDLTERLLGGQVIGRYGAEVSKRLDVLAAGVWAGLAVTELIDLDMSYTPPLSGPWDPVQQAAQSWLNGG